MKRIPIVDENDEIVRYINSSERDLNNEIMRVSVLWLLNEKNEVLISLRSKNKKSFPNVWSESVCGTNEEGETYESNILKEAKEELGIDIMDVSVGIKERLSLGHEFFCQYFFAKISSETKFILQESEVDAVRWIAIEELKKWCDQTPEAFVPEFRDSINIVENYENQN